MADLQDKTRDELYELAQERDIDGRSTMNRDELIEALEEDADGGGDGDGGEDGDGGDGSEDGDGDGATGSGGGSASTSGAKPAEVLRGARDQLAELVGLPVEGVSEFERRDDGWEVVLVVRELERVPTATDVLGLYEVRLDADGDLQSFARISRYTRAQVETDE